MSLSFISVKCPECGANLPVEEGRNQVYCSYCGASILINNENEHVFRHVDEAGIKQAETDRLVELKRLEMEEKQKASNQKVKTLKIVLSIALGIIMLAALATGSENASMIGLVCGIILMYMWLIGMKTEEENDAFDGRAKVPSGILDYEKKSYMAIESLFRAAGFTNIRCVPLNDLRAGIIKKPDMVESITINGKNIYSGGKKYPPDSAVVITYHSYSRR